MNTRIVALVLSVMVVLGISGCETYSKLPEEAHKTAVYRLKPMDPITITMSGIPEQQKMIEEVVDEKGCINLTHIGTIEVVGCTASELEDKIERAYIEGDIYRNVNINVMMHSQSFYVRGEVKMPGRYPLTTGTTLLQAISSAKGYTEYANQKKIILIRNGKKYRYDGEDLESNPQDDIKIEPGDLIRVERSII